jgi:hypothetical protein
MGLLCDSIPPLSARILYIPPPWVHIRRNPPKLELWSVPLFVRCLVVAAAFALASPAWAECYADYKASKDGPLRLHYGVMEVPDDACDPAAAERVVERRLRDAGWKLLGVMSVFGREGLDERRDSAGEFFLRY